MRASAIESGTVNPCKLSVRPDVVFSSRGLRFSSTGAFGIAVPNTVSRREPTASTGERRSTTTLRAIARRMHPSNSVVGE